MTLTLKLIYEKISKKEAEEVIEALNDFAKKNKLILEGAIDEVKK